MPPARAPRYLTEFRCIAERCEDSCCARTHIPISRREHAALASVLDKDELDARIQIAGFPRRAVEYAALKRAADGRCGFLRDDALCSLQARYGERALPDTCAAFPRQLAQGPRGLEVTASLACPEAARLALSSDAALEEVELDDAAFFGLPWAARAASGVTTRPEDPFAEQVLALLREPGGALSGKLGRLAALASEAGPPALEMDPRALELQFQALFLRRTQFDSSPRFLALAKAVANGERGAVAGSEGLLGRYALHAWYLLRLQSGLDRSGRALMLALRVALGWFAVTRSAGAVAPIDALQLCARYLEKHPTFFEVFGGALAAEPEARLAVVRQAAALCNDPVRPLL